MPTIKSDLKFNPAWNSFPGLTVDENGLTIDTDLFFLAL